MERVLLGSTGVPVSRFAFGAMPFGGAADRAESERLFHRCREVGIDHFDTADVYTGGESERILGELVAPCRDYASRYGDPEVFDVAERFTALAERHGHHPAALAVAWVAAHPAVTAPLLGANSLAQLDQVLGCVEIDVTPDLYEEISALSRAPAPATDRSEESQGITYGKR